MSKKFVKWVTLFLSLVMVLSLCACGDSGDSEPNNESSKIPTNNGSTNQTPGNEADEEENTPATLEKNDDGLYMIYNVEDLITYRSILEDEMAAALAADPRFIPEATSGAILMADIDMSSVCGKDHGNWRPIGMGVNEELASVAGRSCITFEGNGFAISGLYMDTQETGGGLFADLTDATVTNLTFRSCSLNCNYGAGGETPSPQYGTGVLSMHTDGATIRDCVVEADVTVSGRYSVGSLVGVANEGGNLFERCINRAAITAADGFAGGIVGQAIRNTDLFYCDNYGTISGENSDLGGLVGTASGSSSYAGNILGCVNYGDVVNLAEGHSDLGGIVGSSNTTVCFCINMGTIQANGGDGYDITNYNEGSMGWCINTGTVVGSDVPDEFAYASIHRDGYNLSPDAPELKDGSLLADDKLGSYFWTQGENFPVWNGVMP